MIEIETLTPAELEAVLTAGGRRISELAAALEPVVKLSISRALRRHRGASQSDLDDLSQQTLLDLLQHDARTLRRWDPALGLKLSSFARLVASRVARAHLRRLGHQQPGQDLLVADSAMWIRDPSPLAEERLLSGEALCALVSRLTPALSPLGLRLFQLLFLEQASTSHACRELGMQPAAVYAWRSRITKLIRRTS